MRGTFLSKEVPSLYYQRLSYIALVNNAKRFYSKKRLASYNLEHN